MILLAAHVAHVIVDRTPVDPWSAIAAKAAIGAVVFAGLTFAVAIVEVFLVSQDLKNNTEQLKEFRKRPRLGISVTCFGRPPNIDPYNNYVLAFLIGNEGERVARSPALDVCWIDNGTIVPHIGVNIPLTMIDGLPYRLAHYNLGDIMYPHAAEYPIECGIRVRSAIKEIEILYRAFDDVGIYPEDDYARETFKLDDV